MKINTVYFVYVKPPQSKTWTHWTYRDHLKLKPVKGKKAGPTPWRTSSAKQADKEAKAILKAGKGYCAFVGYQDFIEQPSDDVLYARGHDGAICTTTNLRWGGNI